MLAIIEAYRSGLLKNKNWWPNIIAGLIVAVVALPLAMAFAIASGVKPEQGLYTAIISALVVGILVAAVCRFPALPVLLFLFLQILTRDIAMKGCKLPRYFPALFFFLLGLLNL